MRGGFVEPCVGGGGEVGRRGGGEVGRRGDGEGGAGGRLEGEEGDRAGRAADWRDGIESEAAAEMGG